MRELSARCAAAAKPEGRQPLGVWEAFARLRLPNGLQDFVRKALWWKLEVSALMLMCLQAPTAVCALSGAREDHHHALNSYPFLEGGIALARVSWSLRFNKHAWVEPSRICWDVPQLSLSTHVGLFMWAVLFASWKHRCDVVFGRAHPEPSRVLARPHGVLGPWAAEHEPSIPRSDILELSRRVSLRLQTQQLRFRTTVGDMPLEAGVPAMQARFQDGVRWSSRAIRRAYGRWCRGSRGDMQSCGGGGGRQTSRRHTGSDVSRASIAPCHYVAAHYSSRVCTADSIDAPWEARAARRWLFEPGGARVFVPGFCIQHLCSREGPSGA